MLARSVFAATLDEIVDKISAEIIDPLILLFLVLGTLVFVWGVIEMITAGESEEKRTNGKKHIFWGLIGLFIMLSAWGIIAVLENFWASI